MKKIIEGLKANFSTKRGKIVFALEIVLIISVIIAIILILNHEKKPKDVEITPEATISKETEIPQIKPNELVLEDEEEEEIEEEPVITHEGEAINLLNGKYVDEKKAKKRPVAVMIGNTNDALPQYGLSKADVLFEIMAEGGLTRLMAIFSDVSGVDKIGSVRSSRLYYAHYAVEFDAIYCHIGQARFAESYLNSSAIDNLSGLDGKCASVYYRDSSKRAPHNCYVGEDGIDKGIEAKNYRRKYEDDYEGVFTFSNPDEKPLELEESLSKRAEVIVPGYGIDNPWLIYDSKKNHYSLYHYRKEHIDGNNDKQLTFENVIFLYENSRVLDSLTGYLEFDNVGSGEGMFFKGGRCENITWKKDDLKSATKCYDENGNEIVLTPGKTYVCVIQNSQKDRVKTYKTEQEYNESK